ncbi:MAG: hypothetical protein ACI4PE_05855, partial [Bacilli bacterium]
MENRYSICKDENGKIIWVSIENQNGEVEIKKIKNTTDNTKYMEELRSIDSEYNDFFNEFFGGEIELKKASYFENMKKAEQKQKYKEYKKSVKENHKADNKMMKKIAAISTAAVLALTTIAYGIGTTTKLSKESYAKSTSQSKDGEISEQNPQLLKIYEKLLKTKNGKKIVKQLQETDQWQSEYNERMAKYQDADGDVLFLKAREVSAVQDISNAENTNFVSLDYDETRFCDYLSAGAVTHKGLYVSEESTGEYTLIHDENTRNEMKTEEDFALSAIKGNKTTKEIDNHFEELMETGLTYTASGVNVAYLGEGSNIVISDEGRSSKKLVKFIEKVKTNNEGANKLDSYAKSKDVTDKQRELIDKAWIEMDKQNINVDLKSRDKFDMETTEKGLKMHAALVSGGYLIGGTTTYTYVTKSGKTIKISKKEAIKKFGKEAVKEAEKKADANVKVDTDGDGKKDTSMNEANKKEEEKKEQLEQEASNYEKDYAQGRSDGYAGRGKAKNTPGYNAGYANGQKQRAAENEPDEIIEKKEEYKNAPAEEKSTPQTETTPTQTQSAPVEQKVMTIE